MGDQCVSLITDDHLNVIMRDGSRNPDVWAIGDAAKIEDAPLPATAQGQTTRSTAHLHNLTWFIVANQKGKYLVKKLRYIARDREHIKPFEFHNQGSLAYIGDWYVMYDFRF